MAYDDLCVNGPANPHVLSAPNTESNDELAKPSLAAKTYWLEGDKINDTLSTQQAHKAVFSRDIDYRTKSSSQPDIKANSRMLRVVTTSPLVKLHSSSPATRSPKMVYKGWKDWFESHCTLWKNGIEHSDISLDNLMLDPILGVGVLHDFDLLKNIGWNVRSERQIGTVAFAAFDLLKKETIEHHPVRMYRHDVESLIWVLVWVCLNLERIGEKPKGMDRLKMTRQICYFRSWMNDPSASEDVRSDFLKDYLTDCHASPRFEKLWTLAMRFLEWFNDRDRSREKRKCAWRVLLWGAFREPSEGHLHQEIANLVKSFEASPAFASLTE